MIEVHDAAKRDDGLDRGFANIMASDLVGLRTKPFCDSHSWTAMVHDSILASTDVTVVLVADKYNWVSSAYWWKLISFRLV